MRRLRCPFFLFLVLLAAPMVAHRASAEEAAATLTLAWNPNPEPDVAGYIVYVGTESGNYSRTFDVGKVTTFTYTQGTSGQRYYFSVAAYAPGSLQGPRSSEVSGVAGEGGSSGGGSGGGSTSGGSAPAPVVTPPPPPSPGVVLQPATQQGSSVTLAWGAVGGLSVLEYMLEAGSASGLSNLYNASVGNLTTISGDVADGIYFVRVRARTSPEASVASNEIRIAVGSAFLACTTAPATPTAISGSVVGDQATLAWAAAPGATSYIVQAGSAPGLSDVYYGDVGGSPIVSAVVAPGFSAYVRVVAVNVCGQSAASAEILLQ